MQCIAKKLKKGIAYSLYNLSNIGCFYFFVLKQNYKIVFKWLQQFNKCYIKRTNIFWKKNGQYKLGYNF